MSGGEYQNLEYDCGGSFIYNTNKGKERCYHCDNKGDIKINSAMNNLQLCDTAYTNYITTYHPGRQDMIKPDQCNWDMLSDDYKSQYTLKNNCTWDNLSEAKRKTANDIATQGMIKSDQCNWDMLSDDDKSQYTLKDSCTFEDLNEFEKSKVSPVQPSCPPTAASWRCGGTSSSMGGGKKCPRMKNGNPVYCDAYGWCRMHQPSNRSNSKFNSDETMCMEM